MNNTPTEDELERLRFKLVFGGVLPEDFLLKYEDEIGHYEDEIVEAEYAVTLPRHGLSTLQVLRGGLVIQTAVNGKMSLFETKERVEEREHLRKWAEFARGYWTSKVPTAAGYYPVRAKDGKLSWHEIRYAHGRLVDVNSGHVPGGRVTTWTGDWWSLCLPSLPGSY